MQEQYVISSLSQMLILFVNITADTDSQHTEVKTHQEVEEVVGQNSTQARPLARGPKERALVPFGAEKEV